MELPILLLQTHPVQENKYSKCLLNIISNNTEPIVVSTLDLETMKGFAIEMERIYGIELKVLTVTTLSGSRKNPYLIETGEFIIKK